MPTLERGFKSWSERVAQTLRDELGLESADPVDPLELAKILGIEILTPHGVPGLPSEVLEQLLQVDPWGWSALSLKLPDGRFLLIYNPRKSSGRQASDIIHELAHFILDHKPATIILSPDGELAMRSFDPKQEEEANWLGWCILLPRDALLKSRRKGLEIGDIAKHYGVTESLVRFRLNKSGVDTQLYARRRR